MTDLEITRLCAEAMFDALEWEQRLFDYDPLHDDAQMAALVKKFLLTICGSIRIEAGVNIPEWAVYDGRRISHWNGTAVADNLNRAVCEAVANMQSSKKVQEAV